MPFLSPLRYPGGKRRLTNFFKLVVLENDILDGEYAEPYAGGASIGLALLFDNYVRKIHINDLDYAVYSFWFSVLNETETICKLIRDTPVTIEEWYRQKNIQNDPNSSLIDKGFSTFFLNRTNRSGIISGGVIGGKNQTGNWKIDARFNKANLISRIQKIALYRTRIRLYNMDASKFIIDVLPRLSEHTLVYFDPPYFIKGQQLLYTNFYQPTDHEIVSGLVKNVKQNWIVTYDNVPEIRKIYFGLRHIIYGLNYSAQDRYKGSEVMFISNSLEIPETEDPTKIKNRLLHHYLF
ncbi:MAG: DNA adenine methylase [Anaerolineales bacterium]|nr:DNA adenine methylase [Anaerolineales bacterium]